MVAGASDGRLKINQQPITNAVYKIKQITGITFDWDMNKLKELDYDPIYEHDAGLIAQEVQKVLPEAVHLAPFDTDPLKCEGSKSGQNYLTVQYEKVVPLLVEAIKEQQQLIENQQQQIEALRDIINGN